MGLELVNNNGLEKMDFNLLNKPLINSSETFFRILKNSSSLLDGLLAQHLEGALEIYQSILYLIKDTNKTKYPFPAEILLRSIVDNFFNVAYLLSNPEQNVKEYNKVGYQMMRNDLEEKLTSVRNDPQESKSIIDSIEKLDNSPIFSHLTKEQKENVIKNPPKWHNVGKIKRKLSSEDDKDFFDKVYKIYGYFSDVFHFNMRGASHSVLSKNPDSDEAKLFKFISNIRLGSAGFLTMILSEIQSKKNCNMENDLRYIWGLLINFGDVLIT